MPRMVSCPYCEVQVPEGDAQAEIAHMQECHPETIEERLRQAGDPSAPHMRPQPDLDDPGGVYVHRAIQALYREFEDDEQVPRFVVVCETPPDGRINIASSGDNEMDTHRMLTLAAASVRNVMPKLMKERARQYWDTMKAGFERRN